MMNKQILLGTRNQAKINIVRAALASLPIEVLTLSELHIEIEVIEDGQSAEENAEKKARAYLAASGLPTLAIDGALRVYKFPEEMQPGVFIRRICSADGEATDKDVLNHYIEELDKVGGESLGHWKGAVALAIAEDKVFSGSFSYQTILTTQRRGGVTVGAPLDAIAIDPLTGKYYTEMRWIERPDAGWIFEFLEQYIGEL